MTIRMKRQKMTPEVRQQILAIYEETMSVRETGRRVNVHENSVRLVLKASKGQCADCQTKILLGKRYCADCDKRRANWMKERRKERRRQGLCTECDERIQPPSTQFCDKHRLAHAEVSRVHDAKSNRWAPGRLPEDQQREKQIRYNYGQAGIEVWHRDKASCVLCDVHYRERSVHIHHLDHDHDNNVVENMACLCLHCHYLIHGLTQHAQPHRLLHWLVQHYPQSPLGQLARTPKRVKKSKAHDNMLLPLFTTTLDGVG